MAKKLSPDTPIMGLDNVTIQDFWAWAYSDVLGNRIKTITLSRLNKILAPIEYNELRLTIDQQLSS